MPHKVECYHTEDGLQYTYDANSLRANNLISSVRVVSTNPVHARVKVWNRGGLAGELVIGKADLDPFLCRVLDCSPAELTRAREGAVATKYAEGRV